MKREKLKKGERTTLWFSRIAVWLIIIVVMFPALWIIMASFSKGDSFFMTSLIPDKLGADNYISLFQETDFMLWIFNSLKLCLIVAVIQLILTSLAAYAFSRMRFPGKSKGLMTLLVLQVFPNSMALAGYYDILLTEHQ